MRGFIDETVLVVSSGNGGAGAVSFRREKFVPKGGPDGGDGGRGGDVLFRVKQNVKTLSHLTMKHAWRAENGEPGKGGNRFGKDGAPVVIKVPPGTVIKDPDTGEILADLTQSEGDFVFLRGGIGGKGNRNFKSSVNQAPRYAQSGKPGEERRIKVEINLIADIGFVGFPNAGKSSLLDVLTNARPEIAPYPFTTKIPNLGVLSVRGETLVLADIPGIIEGAGEGAGLGFKFLKHISRTKALAFLIDGSDSRASEAFPLLLNELRRYGAGLSEKPRVVIVTKIDLPESAAVFKELKNSLPEETVLPLSSFTREGLDTVAVAFLKLAEGQPL